MVKGIEKYRRVRRVRRRRPIAPIIPDSEDEPPGLIPSSEEECPDSDGSSSSRADLPGGDSLRESIIGTPINAGCANPALYTPTLID